jgi:type II secretory pathway component PulL
MLDEAAVRVGRQRWQQWRVPLILCGAFVGAAAVGVATVWLLNRYNRLGGVLV